MFPLLFLLFRTAVATLPACASGVTCPTGGIWSEWASLPDAKCAEPCGSCAQIYQTRTCLSTRASCPCTGDYSRYTPCNTQGCAYPAQKTCCVPHTLMAFNGSLQCGPLPKIENAMSCCPSGGVWTTWTGFGRNAAGQWLRTRDCVSDDVGCACTGDSTLYSTSSGGCPCGVPAGTTKCTEWWNLPSWHPEFVIDTTNCYAHSWFYAYDFNSTNLCETPLNSTSIQQYGIFGYEAPDGSCNFRMPVPCVATKTSLIITSTCDLNTASWMMDYSYVAFAAFNQFEYLYGTVSTMP